MLFCDFEIRQLQNSHHYTLQCIINRVDDSVSMDDTRIGKTRTHSTDDVSIDSGLRGVDGSVGNGRVLSTQSVVQLYQALFTLVLCLNFILLTCILFTTITWFFRLFLVSYATAMGLPSNAAMDLVFLANMASLNVGVGVAKELAGSDVTGRHDDGTRHLIAEGETMIDSSA